MSASRDKTIKYWSVNSEKPEFNLLGHDLVVTALSSNNENDMLISGSRDNKINLWNLKTGQIISTAQISRNLVGFLMFAIDFSISIHSRLNFTDY